MQIDFSAKHPRKHPPPISRSLDPDSKLIVASPTQPAKHAYRITSTDRGMQICTRREHIENAHSSILVSRDPGSKVTSRISRQPSCPPKHPAPIDSTEAGIAIDVSDLQSENGRPSNLRVFEGCSNVTDESDLHPEKQ
jgi:hypothetical protein